MEQRMSLITLGVADLRRAVAFYENVIGWKPSRFWTIGKDGRMSITNEWPHRSEQ